MTKISALTLFSDDRFYDHDTGGGLHPEVPERLQVILQQLEQSQYKSSIKYLPSSAAERKFILNAHDEAWLFRFEEAVLSGKSYIDHTDNQVCYHSYDIASLAAGAPLAAIDLIETDLAEKTFCLVRPPGHHAERNKPYGFCFLNNCVIAARYWQMKYEKKRIVVFDFDAHHGNGIQSALECEDESIYISIHEHPSFSYPGTGYEEESGIGAGSGTIYNFPLPPGSGDERVIRLVEEHIEPVLERFEPQAIIIASGFDGHMLDDMSGLSYSTELFGYIGDRARVWSDVYTEGKLLSVLEGGYELSVLGESVSTYIDGLLGLRH